MENKYHYIGEIDNWMDLRDGFIEYLEHCDTELKFNQFIESIILSVGISPEGLQKTREALGVPKFTKKEFKVIEELFKDGKRI